MDPKNIVDTPKVTVPPASTPQPEHKAQFDQAKPAAPQPAQKPPIVPAR